MLVILSESCWVFAFAQRIAGEPDDKDEYNQANNDADDGNDDCGLAPVRCRPAGVEACLMLSLPIGRRWYG
jgi:hypothetical protein